ncbi:MAG: ImmA/IrrE family metallo-endopeptidase [Leuconostoc pseudomesenteroides]|uniref:ImmA/IrrE family metallo-endopeptidase n=1 Tax=Leuconostoc pseudomesenteroides TaxID=33968 RepID=UPI001E546440|nr:ImmA/IrrE family metallo-endopeptidase [Leuconostoc pseudomesenteroides]MCC7668890.1 ImmA/IrrE family metallo-endopeptidase [Leuconostoc pseudomesenteroides]
MNNIEIYIDKFPQYKFYGIEVENKYYYGEADKVDGIVTIFINTLQPEWKQLNTIIHESAHAEFDVFGDSKRWSMKTMLAEKQAQYIARHFISWVSCLLQLS